MFNARVWALFIGSFAACLAVFLLLFLGYSRISKEEQGIMADNVGYWRIVIKVVSTITEPDSIDFFPTWSAGEGSKQFVKEHMLTS